MKRIFIGSFVLLLLMGLIVLASQAQLQFRSTDFVPSGTNTIIKVVNAGKGSPIQGVNVQIRAPEGRFFEALTNSKGEAYFNLTDGKHAYLLFKRGLKTISREFEKSGGKVSINATMKTLLPFPTGLVKQMVNLNVLTIKPMRDDVPPDYSHLMLLGGVFVEVRPDSLENATTDFGVQGITDSQGKIRIRAPQNGQPRHIFAAKNGHIMAAASNLVKFNAIDFSDYVIYPSGKVTYPSMDVPVDCPLMLIRK